MVTCWAVVGNRAAAGCRTLRDGALTFLIGFTAPSVTSEQCRARTMHACRNMRDGERLLQYSETLITWAAVTLVARGRTQQKWLSR
ncbi:hypothetical protein DN051_39265 [Streptomyces cadmiisoli]|uniref:Uncharacterized protein n=1 Tax=Streptomyces cadmiisoli TaxID=2184053 RepID=A0A2Z4J9M4_9ACTN|nr:hypothetical protein DN051_39265 [Streptomyces cadmiisoli]